MSKSNRIVMHERNIQNISVRQKVVQGLVKALVYLFLQNKGILPALR